MKNMKTQSMAAKVLVDIIINRRSLQKQDSALCQEICYGVMRWQVQLDFISQQLLQKPLAKKNALVHILILIGLYHIIYLRTPDHAAVNTTVEAAKELGKSWAGKLINGVLRNFIRQRESLLNFSDLQITHACPEWLYLKTKKQWPKEWQKILAKQNEHAPLTLRINQQKINTQDYLLLLAENNIAGETCQLSPQGVRLTKAQSIPSLPGFNEAYFSVQDEAAQFSASLLALKPGQRVLDACAAPGGKTCHILESEVGLSELVAIDNNAKRLEKVRENCQRLGLKATLLTADAGDTEQWWDGKPFDRILLDAPCSASGVIRRHPDIKHLRLATDIANLQQQQQTLLRALWPLLKPGGLLLYATCSIFHDENQQSIAKFLAATDDAIEEKIQASWGREMPHGRQILPGENNMDGFYYALLTKTI